MAWTHAPRRTSASSSPACSPRARSPSRSPRRAQEEGAEVVLTGFGRGLRITAARRPAAADRARRARARRQRPRPARGPGDRARRPLGPPRRRPARDRLRPRRRAGRQLPDRAADSASPALRDERVLAEGARGGAAAAARAARRPAARSSASTSTPRVAWPAYDWAGVSKAALESRQPLPRARPRAARRARQPRRRRPAATTVAAEQHRRLRRPRRGLGSARRRSAGTSTTRAPVADACLFLLSPLARAITGEILHVDGGFHAVGAAPVGA